jgi:hypothetical protein
VVESDSVDGELRWDVSAALIDLDRWGTAFVEVSLRLRKEQASVVSRRARWLVAALLIVLVLLTREPVVFVSLALALATTGGAVLWNRGAARRMSKKLRALPAASEPFTFVASVHGTQSRSASGSEELSWSRYQSVFRHDDLIVFVLDTGALRFLPIAALAPRCSADEAVRTAVGWLGHGQLSVV